MPLTWVTHESKVSPTLDYHNSFMDAQSNAPLPENATRLEASSYDRGDDEIHVWELELDLTRFQPFAA